MSPATVKAFAPMARVPAVKAKLPPRLMGAEALTWGAVAKELFTVRLVKVEEVKSTVWATEPLRVTMPVEVISPEVREMLPATVKPFAPMPRVPSVRVRLPPRVMGAEALTCGRGGEGVVHGEVASVEEVKSTVCAALPLRVTMPVEVISPAVRVMLPATVKAFAPMASVPAVKARAPPRVMGPEELTCGAVANELFTVRLPVWRR